MVGLLRIAAITASLLSLAFGDEIPNSEIRIGQGSQEPCGSNDPPEELTEFHRQIMNETQSTASDRKMKMRRQYYPIEIPVYWHVLAASYNFTDGYLTRQQVVDSIAVLNNDFEPHSIYFKLIASYVTINPQWADGQAYPDDSAIRRQLHQGGYNALNIYSKRTIEDGYLGFCHFPQNLTIYPQYSYLDGCQINYGTIPKGNIFQYDQGKVLTHEVGHWFGLYHTFHGRTCSGDGDFIADTPTQSTPPFECDDSIDSCPLEPGRDAWDNHMNYVPDRCKNEFTYGQEYAMKAMYRQFRGQGFGG